MATANRASSLTEVLAADDPRRGPRRPRPPPQNVWTIYFFDNAGSFVAMNHGDPLVSTPGYFWTSAATQATSTTVEAVAIIYLEAQQESESQQQHPTTA